MFSLLWTMRKTIYINEQKKNTQNTYTKKLKRRFSIEVEEEHRVHIETYRLSAAHTLTHTQSS